MLKKSHGPQKFVLVEGEEGKHELETWSSDEMTSGDSRSSQEQWTKESKNELRWKDMTKAFHEAGPHIKERRTAWQKRCKESPDREEDLLTQAAEFKVSEARRRDLADSFRVLKKISDELGTEEAPKGRSLDDSWTAHGVLGARGKGNLKPSLKNLAVDPEQQRQTTTFATGLGHLAELGQGIWMKEKKERS